MGFYFLFEFHDECLTTKGTKKTLRTQKNLSEHCVNLCEHYG